MPGSNTRALEKAKSIPADALILDLEDAVAPDRKDIARSQVCAAAASGDYGYREIAIRINGLDTPWGHDDLKAAVAAKPDAILIPKIDGASMVRQIESMMEQLGAADKNPHLGDARDATRAAARRGYRRREQAVGGAGDGHQRHRQGTQERPPLGSRPTADEPRVVPARCARTAW